MQLVQAARLLRIHISESDRYGGKNGQGPQEPPRSQMRSASEEHRSVTIRSGPPMPLTTGIYRMAQGSLFWPPPTSAGLTHVHRELTPRCALPISADNAPASY